MAAIPVFKGKVDECGRIQLLEAESRKRRSHLIMLAGQDIEVIYRKPRRQRSTDQLRYWFGVPMRLLSKKTGYTKLQMHYLCLAICFGVVVDPKTGREIPVVPASKALSTKQFSELIEWCPPWAWDEWQMSIPLPNDVDLDSLPGDDESEAA